MKEHDTKSPAACQQFFGGNQPQVVVSQIAGKTTWSRFPDQPDQGAQNKAEFLVSIK